MMSLSGKQTNFAMYKLANISRSKGNQTIKCQLKNMTWEPFFLKNNSQNMVEKLFAELFLKNQNGAYLWINSLKFHTVCFYSMPSRGLSNYIKMKL